MAKMLKIKACADCPFLDTYFRDPWLSCDLDKEDRQIDGSKDIPDWCPLPDYPETDKISSLIESAGRPKVDEKFIEKWAEHYFRLFSDREYMEDCMYDELKAILKEAGVEVEDPPGKRE